MAWCFSANSCAMVFNCSVVTPGRMLASIKSRDVKKVKEIVKDITGEEVEIDFN